MLCNIYTYFFFILDPNPGVHTDSASFRKTGYDLFPITGSLSDHDTKTNCYLRIRCAMRMRGVNTYFDLLKAFAYIESSLKC